MVQVADGDDDDGERMKVELGSIYIELGRNVKCVGTKVPVFTRNTYETLDLFGARQSVKYNDSFMLNLCESSVKCKKEAVCGRNIKQQYGGREGILVT